MVTLLPSAPPIDSTEFEAITRDWRERAELIAGEIHVLPAPAFRHQAIVMRLVRKLDAWIGGAADRGMVFDSPIDVQLSEHDRVQPDVAWWADGLDLDVTPGPPPDLAVEVLSPSTRRRDVGVKRRAYEAAEVQELWLGDPADRSVTRLSRSEGSPAFDRSTRQVGEEVLGTALMPGLAIEVASLFPA